MLDAMKKTKTILKWTLGIIYILAGTNHFINPDFYLKMMPPIFPAHLFLIYLSGIFEILFGVLLLVPRFSRIGAWGIIGTTIAVTPANIYMAMNPEMFSEFSPIALYLRLPLQIIPLVWAYWFTKE